jgi:hypothetical protein
LPQGSRTARGAYAAGERRPGQANDDRPARFTLWHSGWRFYSTAAEEPHPVDGIPRYTARLPSSLVKNSLSALATMLWCDPPNKLEPRRRLFG